MEAIEVEWTEAEEPGLLLRRGPGDGDRLLAPGVPEELLAAGGLLCWTGSEVVAVADPGAGQVRVVALGERRGPAAEARRLYEEVDPEAGGG